MDQGHFDALTRRLAGTASRRSVARGFLGGVAAAIGAKGIAGAALAAKVEICHRTGNGSYQAIVVDGNAVNAHLGHGDQICTNPSYGTSACTPSGCTVTCDAGYDGCDSGCCKHVVRCDPDQTPCGGGCCITPVGMCWRQSDTTGDWIPTSEIYGNLTYEQCKSQDHCFTGGGGNSGGCYKWTSGQTDPFSEWPI